jgi:hypothetical protein
MTIDELRSRFPTLALAVYAMEPGGPVTFEVYDDGQVYTFTGDTVEAAVSLAFPADVLDEPTDDQTTPTTNTPNVFD